MAEAEHEKQEQPAAGKSGMLGLLVLAVVGLVSSAGGFAAPLIYLSMASPKAEEPELPHAFIQFGDTVANLDEGRLNRFLRVSITLQIDKVHEEEFVKQLEENKTILKSWLISYLSDRTMDDIRGRSGQNRLRREIQDHFNSVLSPDGYQRVRDVLFEEFNIQ
jgi:flagellar basal body-associated protein FliL